MVKLKCKWNSVQKRWGCDLGKTFLGGLNGIIIGDNFIINDKLEFTNVVESCRFQKVLDTTVLRCIKEEGD